MWNRLESRDIDSARESLGQRLGETMRRQEEELTTLRAKHAEEIRSLEAKQADIDRLNGLIKRFAQEFQGIAATEPEPAAQQQDADTASPTESAERGQEQDEKSDDQGTEPKPTALSLPERIAVRYASPNFGMGRKFGS